jgi:YD repeat-containing protein
MSHSVLTPAGQIVTQRDYKYDDKGNVTLVQLDSTICIRYETNRYVVRYSYSQDGRNLLLVENHNEEREFTYFYYPDSNLLSCKLTFADGGFVEREFYEYNDHAILIRKIVDDGSHFDMNNLTNVTYRRVIEIEPQMNPDLPGMTLPSRILESTEHKEYDVQGNVTHSTDKDGYVTKTLYNYYGKPLKIEYPDGTVKTFTYNLQGHLIRERERDGTFVTHSVDYQGRPTCTTYYNSKGGILKTTKAFYKGPNLIQEIDAMGTLTVHQYDGAGRKKVTIQGGQPPAIIMIL